MPEPTTLLVVGGTSGIGCEIAARAAARGQRVVLTGRDPQAAAAVAATIGGDTAGIAVELAEPEGLAAQLADVGQVDRLVLCAISRDQNTVDDYSIEAAMALVTLKLVGYTEVVHQLRTRLSDDGAIVVFGGQAKERPYPGSTTVSTVNGGVVGLVHTLANELAPVRVNGIHPGIVGDSPYWVGKPLDPVIQRTPLGRLATMAEVAHAAEFLLENQAVTGANLAVDGGWTLR